MDDVQYKGWTIKLADWLHLSNADDPGRPIVAQVFKCWVSEELSVQYVSLYCEFKANFRA